MELSLKETEIKTAVYVRISTNQQKTDRQVVELMEFAHAHHIIIEQEDIYIDVISGFKNGEIRPQYSILKQKAEEGKYQQILFSEFSRLDRKPSNLLKSIEFYQNKGVHLYFKKQNIWVRDKSDIATQIMISVLAVMSQYEIELFVSRGIDGKISAIKNRGINDGGLTAYGYSSSREDKKLVVNEAEAEVVRRIFQLYDEGKSSLYIADILNSEGVPSPYKIRLEEAVSRRSSKGLPEKQYSWHSNYEEMKWRPSSINRLIKNKLYIGIRSFTFYEPDPANPLPTWLRGNRHLLQKFDVHSEELRIVDESLFRRVNETVSAKAFNRNLGIRHKNLLKDLMVCGECGGNFSVSGGTKIRKYRCYGMVNRIDKPKSCTAGVELAMPRLDGLVLQMCINKFADYNLDKEAAEKINAASEVIVEKQNVIREYEEQLKKVSDSFSAYARRVLKSAATDDEVRAWVEEERRVHDIKVKEMTESIERAKNDIIALKTKIAAYSKMKSRVNLISRQKEIISDRNLVQEYVRGFIRAITVYRVSRLWALVVVSFMDGGERWGTIKTCRYRKDEVIRNPETGSFEYTGLFIDNDSHKLSYDKGSTSVSIRKGSPLYESESDSKGVSFEEFMKRATAKKLTGSYAPYQFEEK